MRDWKPEIEARLASLKLEAAREAEIVEEISQHLDERYAELRNQGLDEAVAVALVRAELLDEKTLAEFMQPLRQSNTPPPLRPVGAPRRKLESRGRGLRSVDFFDSVGRDLRHTLRSLPRRPAFTLAVVLTLALGIGATTAIFSVVYSVLLKPLPYPDAEQLVRIRHLSLRFNGADFSASSNMHLTYREENTTFAASGLWEADSATLTERGEAERVRVVRVTDGTLQALRVQPVRGRWFTEREHLPDADGPSPVILSHAFWQRRFGGDESALGRELSLDSPGGAGTLALPSSARVVGIMPAGFEVPDVSPQPEIIIPVRMDPARQAHGIFDWQMLARLKPGVTLSEAQADLDRMQPIWLNAWPPFPGTTLEHRARRPPVAG